MMDGKISVDDLIHFLVQGYRNMLKEEGGDICAKELVEGWPNDIKNANYDENNDCVTFQVFEDNYLPDIFKKLARFTTK